MTYNGGEDPWGYLPELANSILVFSVHNVAQLQRFFCGIGLTIVTGGRYLGGYISM